ncbi:MAG: M48 family metallopeptidase [bacterium]|nr:M48 family metallopeptidase [bacterium]
MIKQDISTLKQNKDKDKGLKSTFLTASNYQIERILRSGNALVNDEITTYLNEITDVILKDNPTLRKQLNVFTLKSSVVNAYSYDKGYIFIDIGLIAQLESEAQLAYILCHEISHYTKQHHINSFVINDKIDRERYDGNNESKFIEKCQYSKEYESEADLEGLKLFERTTYDLKQAEKGFTVLQYSHLPFELVEFKKAYFENPNYKIPNRYFLPEVSPIKDNSNEDDSKLTHPNAKKRRLAIAEIISERDNTKRVKAIVGQPRFEYIRDLSRMELCRLYLKDRDYPNALYASYILAKKYPSNSYVAEEMAKSLYGISLYLNGEIKYNKDSHLEEGIPKYTDIESYPQQIYYMIDKMPVNEWIILSLNQVYRLHKKFPESNSLEVLSDSLFGLMKRIDWGISDFAHVLKSPLTSTVDIPKDSVLEEEKSKTELIASLQKEINNKAEDTIYYKTAYVDLFMNDPEFSRKFPSQDGGAEKKEDGFKSYSSSDENEEYEHRKRGSRNIRLASGLKVDTIILVEPFYIKIDERDKQSMQYVTSDEKQEHYVKTVEACAKDLKFEVVKLDPGLMTAMDVDKMNDFSVINDWFDERFDADAERKVILNTNDIEQIIKKYGSSYVLKTGVASVVNEKGKKRTFYFGFLFDIRKNELVYRKYEIFKSRDQHDLISSKTYQMLFEIKHPKKRLR